jgi:hypothetical protein
MNANGLDYSLNGFHGILAGYASYDNDRCNEPISALSVMGGGEHLEVGSPPGFNPLLGNAITVAAWVYMNPNNSSQVAFVSKWNFDGINDQFLLFMDGGFPVFAIGDGATYVAGLYANTAMQSGRWYHLVGTWDATGMTRLYINGTLNRSGNDPVGAITHLNNATNKSLNIGNETGAWRALDGRVDDVRIYNRVLNASEVQNIYQQTVSAGIAVSSDVTTICAGATVNFTASVTGEGSAPSYQWYILRNGIPNPVSPNGSLSTLTYSNFQNGDRVYCTMISSDPCAAPSTVTSNQITINVIPNQTLSATLSASPSLIVCAGTSVTVSANTAVSAASYSWYRNGVLDLNFNGSTYSFQPSNGDQVYCQIYALSGCVTPLSVTTNTVSFSVSSGPVIAPSSTAATCSQANGCVSAAVTGQSPYQVQWTNSNNVIVGSTLTVCSLPAGTYTVTITDANGCVRSSAVTVANLGGAIISANVITNVTCFGGSTGSAGVYIQSGAVPYTIAWSPAGGTGSIANNLSAGSYTVTVTDANSCTATSSVLITQPTPVLVSISGTSPSCYGASNGSAVAVASGGTPGYTCIWRNGANQQISTSFTASNLVSGTYTVLVTDGNGCTASASVAISQPSAISCTVSGQDPTCNNPNSGNACVSVSGGASPYTYSWFNGGTSSISNSSCAQNLAAGTYTVIVTDASGCTSTGTKVLSNPIVNPTINTNYLGDSICVNVSPLTATSWQWSVILPSGTAIPLAGNSSCIVGYTCGLYMVTVATAQGCTGASSATYWCSVDVSEFAGLSGLKIYPNPSDGEAYIEFTSSNGYTVNLFSANGQLVRSDLRGSQSNGLTHIPLLTSELPDGVYFVRVTNDGAAATLRMVVIHN